MEPSQATKPPRRHLLLKILIGACGLLVLAIASGLFAAEHLVNSQKDGAFADLSKQLGRPVTSGHIDLSLLHGRFEIRDLVIGKDPTLAAEPDPALRVALVRVQVGLWSAITSLGKTLHIQEVTVEGTDVAVVKLPDGRLNWQVLADKLATEPKKETEEKPLDPEVIQKVRHAVLEKLRFDEARLRFIDATKGNATVEIAHVDLDIDNATLSAPFEVKLSAAVLAAAKNFTLDAHLTAAPEVAGQIAPPPVDRIVVKLAPTALAPLAPFLGALSTAGLGDLTAGQLAIDLTAAPGNAVPGGQGATVLQGAVALTGASFAGGERFDAHLDSDVNGDVTAGTLQIKRFEAKLGEMGLTATGHLSNLLGDKPDVEGFTVTSTGLDFTRLHAYYPPLDKTAGVLLRGPFSFEAKGAAVDNDQKVTARLDLSKASLEVPGQFRKAAGTTLTLDVRASAKPNVMHLEQALLTMASWTLKAAATVHTQGSGKSARQSFDATVEAPLLPVRELVGLVAPKMLEGIPPVKVAAKVAAKGTVGNDASLAVDIPAFTVSSGKSELSGKLALANLRAPKVDFEGHAKYLDLDDFIPATPKDAASKETRDTKSPPKPSKDTDKTDKTEPPAILNKVDGNAKLTVDRGRAADIDYQNLRADLGVKGGRAVARALEVDAFGGHFSGAGTELALIDPKGTFAAKGDLSRVDVAALIAHFGSAPAAAAPSAKTSKLANVANAGILSGRLSAKIDLTGKGTQPDDLQRTLAGKMSGRIEDAQFLPAGLLAPIARSLGQTNAGPLLDKYVKGASDKLASVKDRRLGKLAGALHFADGAMELVKPLEGTTPQGALKVAGRVTLAGIADLTSHLDLAPEAASALLGGKVHFDQPVPVDLKIDGPLRDPRIRPADPMALAKVFVAALVRSEAGQALKDKAQAIMSSPQAQQAQAVAAQKEAQARAQAAQVQAAANQQAEQAKAQAAQQAEKAREEAADRAKQAQEAAKQKLRGILGH